MAGTTAHAMVNGPLCPALAKLTNCKAQAYQSEKLPASVLFLVDRSGSMACNPPPTQDSAACEMANAPANSMMPSKWQITTDALKKVFDNLVAQKSTASVGLSFFSNDNVCGVQSMPAVGVNPLSVPQVSSLKGSLDLTTPSGGTPMVGGMVLSYAYLHQEATQPATGCTTPLCGAHGNRYVVVLTDGADSCVPDPNKPEDAADAKLCTGAGSCTNYLVQKAAPDALSANIKTYVIGAPGSESARGYLSALAYAGGTAKNATCNHDPKSAAGDCHFDMATSTDFAGDLTKALTNISGAALGCDFAVPQTQNKVDKDNVAVQYSPGGKGTPTCFAYDNKPCDGGADGWQFAKKSDGTDDHTHIVICGKSCNTIRADVAAKVDVVLGCLIVK
ncbi:MAG TPA: vWA domain-containing protein [Polyangiales bacterium]